MLVGSALLFGFGVISRSGSSITTWARNQGARSSRLRVSKPYGLLLSLAVPPLSGVLPPAAADLSLWTCVHQRMLRPRAGK